MGTCQNERFWRHSIVSPRHGDHKITPNRETLVFGFPWPNVFKTHAILTKVISGCIYEIRYGFSDDLSQNRCMWEAYCSVTRQYPKISLQEERRLIREAKRGGKEQTQELVLRHIGFVIFRIHKRAFPAYVKRFGEDLLSQSIFVLYEKIKTYNLRYYDKEGNFKPVRFVSYIWKFIDGLILASLRKELCHEKRRVTGYWKGDDHDLFERKFGKDDEGLETLLRTS